MSIVPTPDPLPLESSPLPSYLDAPDEPFQLKLFTRDGDADPDPQPPPRHQPTRRPTLNWTLGELWRNHICDQRKARRQAERNLKQLEESMCYWTRFTDDPPLRYIDTVTMTDFVNGLWTLAGRKRGSTVKATTVHKHCRTVQSIYDRCGPMHRRTNPQGLGLLADVPLIVRPDLPENVVDKNFTLDEIGSILRSCPQIEAKLPTAAPFSGWWHNVILFDYNTGLRSAVLLQIRFSWLKRTDQGLWLHVPVGTPHIKVHPGRPFFLNRWADAVVEDQRRRVPSGEDLIFPHPYGESWIYEAMRRLLVLSEIPSEKAEDNKFHGLRKALGTELAKINHVAEKMALGHRDRDIDINYYINRSVMVEALQKLPQPV